MPDENQIKADLPFWVDDWHVDPTTGRIQHDGEEHKLEPKVMMVLVCLAQQPGQVVTREHLEETVWAGMVVGYDSLASTIIKLRKAFGDDSKHPRVIETVPKKGYRLIATVSSAEGGYTPTTEQTEVDATEPEPKAIRSRLVGIAVIALLAVPGLWLFINVTSTDEPAVQKITVEKLAIAVLPFKNLSNDPDQEYFSDGITADLITDLSKLSGLAVIARNSAFNYKNTDVDVRKVAKELGVSYIIEGSVRKAGDQVRISARLIDAKNSFNLWADRFDGTLENIFAFQDEVTSQIIESLQITLTEKDRNRLAHKYSKSIEAYDQFLHGWQNLWLSSREGTLRARDYFKKAIELDNEFARAYANLAVTYIHDYLHGWTDQSDLALQQAHASADKAISLEPNLPQVHWVKGYAHIFSKAYQESIREIEKSIELDPNFADGYALLATTLNYAGKPAQAEIEMQKAMRLNPKHPALYKVIYGEILFNQHDYKNAIDNFMLALHSNPEIEESRLWLAAALAQNGNIDEASWQLEHIRISGGNLSLKRIESVIPFKDPAQRKHLIDGLYKAGLTQ